MFLRDFPFETIQRLLGYDILGYPHDWGTFPHIFDSEKMNSTPSWGMEIMKSPGIFFRSSHGFIKKPKPVPSDSTSPMVSSPYISRNLCPSGKQSPWKYFWHILALTFGSAENAEQKAPAGDAGMPSNLRTPTALIFVSRGVSCDGIDWWDWTSLPKKTLKSPCCHDVKSCLWNMQELLNKMDVSCVSCTQWVTGPDFAAYHFFKVPFLVILDPHVSGLHPVGPIPSVKSPNYLLVKAIIFVCCFHQVLYSWLAHNVCVIWSIIAGPYVSLVMQTSWLMVHIPIFSWLNPNYCLCVLKNPHEITIQSPWNHYQIQLIFIAKQKKMPWSKVRYHPTLVFFVASKIPLKKIFPWIVQ